MATSEDTLSLVLETLAVVVDVDKGKWMTEDLANSLVVAILEVWTKNNRGESLSSARVLSLQLITRCTPDPIFLSIFPDIINSLAASETPGIYETVVKQALPPLCSSISAATSDQSYIAGSAIELVSSLVKASTNGLGEGFFPLLAPSLFKCLSDVEDRDVLQVCVLSIILGILAKDHRRTASPA